MKVYYNEFDPFAAAWLRELIKAGELPDGEIDTRSITEVAPEDVRCFDQAHFFAGIGGWAYALRLAGWPDDRPVWTGSCPCQPFSTAGNQKGKTDERHLWPIWLRLIREHRPATVFGEQVSSAIAHGWLDDVYQGLEDEGYAVGSAVLPACSVGAPHKRDRLWFVAHAQGERKRREQCNIHETYGGQVGQSLQQSFGAGESFVADACCGRLRGPFEREIQQPRGAEVIRSSEVVADPMRAGRPEWRSITGCGSSAWDGGEWRECADGKTRLVEPSVRLLAYGVLCRVGRLRGYGNAIVPQIAAELIKAASK